MRVTQIFLSIAVACLVASCSSSNPLNPGAPGVTNYYSNTISNQNVALVRVSVNYNSAYSFWVCKQLTTTPNNGAGTYSLLFLIDTPLSSTLSQYYPLPDGEYFFGAMLPAMNSTTVTILGQLANPGIGVGNLFAYHLNAGNRYTLTLNVNPAMTTAAALYVGFTNGSLYGSTYNNSYMIWTLTKDL